MTVRHRTAHHERQLQPEQAALAGHAFDADSTAQQFRQLLADRDPQTAAAIAARGRLVGLGEALEYPLLRRLVDADPRIRDLEADPYAVIADIPRRAFHGQVDMSLLGKLDGISNQIHQDLLQMVLAAAKGVRQLR